MARLYLRLYHLVKKLVFLVETGFTGTALGLLARRQWHRVDEMMYHDSARYQTAEHNLSGLFDWEETAIQTQFQNCRRVLLIGAGGGREVIALAKRGIEVVGYECNREFVEYAQNLLREQGCIGRVEFLERDALPPQIENYDGIIMGWSSYMLIIGREPRIRFIREIGRYVDAGAPILLSFFTRNGDSPRLLRATQIANRFRQMLRRSLVEIGDDIAPNYVHRFTEAEIQSELLEAGFRMAYYRPQPPGPLGSGSAVGLRLEIECVAK